MTVSLTPQFKRQLRKLDPQLKFEVIEKIKLFDQTPDHPTLKVHKLKGRLKGAHSFSVNYKIRIVFQYETKDAVVLLAVGSHDVYNA